MAVPTIIAETTRVAALTTHSWSRYFLLILEFYAAVSSSGISNNDYKPLVDT